ncbi:uncharacterized protein Dana_GF28053, isoform B [Drosophila ananassae]|uniref:Uncharacterized protein, isoform A n=1 Tax=Drosophila ananassae TaxID=7217 RepID=A0A0P9C151_DROAN|nr:uncharacterized protein LOC26515462 [Drosophila ananassae]XP_044573225.1 uncharacterized protein LOC26515462 [Drosophila ananassae]KPU77346.1 uncharacterized protein Dana_GF28053, isoform A [Drosophila ananassae]KPU77347.1 uncharacterized protein Dana_GF28053, isoform B [Drosophila ananassae]
MNSAQCKGQSCDALLHKKNSTFKLPTVKTEENFCVENLLPHHQEYETTKLKQKELICNFISSKPLDDSSQNDDYVTTEEVLNQSKFVKTYIQNPDAYFTYDPSVLARLRLEDLKKIPDRYLKWKPICKKSFEQHHQIDPFFYKNIYTFKNATTFLPSNYQANFKISNGTKPNSSNIAYLNPAEVIQNARKFDERVKQLQIKSDDDFDDINGSLNDSCDDLDICREFYLQIQPKNIKMHSNSAPLSTPIPTLSKNMSSFKCQSFLEGKSGSLSPKGDLIPCSVKSDTNKRKYEKPNWPVLMQPLVAEVDLHVPKNIQLIASSFVASTLMRDNHQWQQLRAIKEVTDRQLYERLLAQRY